MSHFSDAELDFINRNNLDLAVSRSPLFSLVNRILVATLQPMEPGVTTAPMIPPHLSEDDVSVICVYRFVTYLYISLSSFILSPSLYEILYEPQLLLLLLRAANDFSSLLQWPTLNPAILLSASLFNSPLA